MTKVFIDGSAGTTGLRIRERLADRSDIEQIILPDELRKDTSARREALASADIAFLCLPDAAAREAVELSRDFDTVIIDTSTAHRTADGWAYGFAELSDAHREAIAASRHIANPGCHASGFIASVYPLVTRGVIGRDACLSAYSLTGYSGGGKSLIAEYEDSARDSRHDSCRIYATSLCHKHLPEMKAVCALENAPLFSPVIGDYYAGMATCVMLPNMSAERVHETLAEHYASARLVSVAPLGGDESVIYASNMAGRDTLRLWVCGHDTQCTVTAVFDNLGKGASGAAIQNMNISMGVDETAGLVL